MLEKIIGLISLFLLALRFIETDITTKIGIFILPKIRLF